VTRIAIDLDGVLYEFERTMRYLLREERGYTGLTTPSQYWDDVTERISPEDKKWLWGEATTRYGLFRHGHVVKHGVRAVRVLRDAGHKLVLVTHRPATAARDTLAWIDFHFGAEDPYPFASAPVMLHNGEPKSLVGADILIDDKPENVEEWESAGRAALLFDQPWNQECRTGTRVRGWYGVLRHLGLMERPAPQAPDPHRFETTKEASERLAHEEEEIVEGDWEVVG